jgi:hypothetical protein
LCLSGESWKSTLRPIYCHRMESVARDTAVHSAVYKYSNSIDIEFVSCTYRLILLGSQQPPLAAFAICFLSTTRARTLKLTTTQTFHDTRSATLSLMVGTTFGDMVLDNHIPDGLGAESNMQARFVIGFSTRSILRTPDSLSIKTALPTLTPSKKHDTSDSRRI